ncbi:MAG: hypothetical protein QG672_1918 [Pseudomonadota bacterium]|nr:hypothetical protein [Pseudomonadota bacterium]
MFQTLGVTIGASQQLWVTLDRYHTRRNASEYGGMVEASASEAEDLLAAAQELHALFRDWLARNRPGALV